jgi:hypothetical protein
MADIDCHFLSLGLVEWLVLNTQPRVFYNCNTMARSWYWYHSTTMARHGIVYYFLSLLLAEWLVLNSQPWDVKVSVLALHYIG